MTIVCYIKKSDYNINVKRNELEIPGDWEGTSLSDPAGRIPTVSLIFARFNLLQRRSNKEV